MPLPRFLPLDGGDSIEDLEKTLLKAEVQLFKDNLARLFLDLHILTEIPSVLPALLSSLAGSSQPYNLTFDYTPKCTSRTVGKDPREVFSQVPPGKFLVIFDIDETLINVGKDPYGNYVLLIRPMVPTLLYLLHKAGIPMGVWTAGAKAHALGVLDIIDPNGYVQFVLHRPYDSGRVAVNWHPQELASYKDRKAFDLLPEEIQERAILFDNSREAIFHPSTRPRSVLVPDFKPPLAEDGKHHTDDRFWLSGLILILRASAAFHACSVHVSKMTSHLSEFLASGILSESRAGNISFLTVNDSYFPRLSDQAVKKVVATLREVQPIVPTESEIAGACMDVDAGAAAVAAVAVAMCATLKRAIRSYS